jgi:hypothetical protein
MVSFLTVWLFAVSLIVTVILALSLWCLSALRTAFALCFNSLRPILLADRFKGATSGASGVGADSVEFTRRRKSEHFEIARDGEPGVMGLLVEPSGRRVTRVAASLNHRDPHSGIAEPSRSGARESAANASALMDHIDRDHHDLSELAVLVKRGGSKADDVLVALCHPDLVRAVTEHFSNGGVLILTPIPVQANKELVPQLSLQRLKDRSPSAKR